MQDKTDAFLYVRDTIADFLKKGNYRNIHLSVALSGGADSVCLLYVLADLREMFSLVLSAIHVHHGIRGFEADEDVRFCEALCDVLHVPFTCRQVDAPAYAKARHISLESAARELRYECFEEYLTAHTGAMIAMAHHADDQAETVLFRMARGTGLRGMCGIPARRGAFIRPCLSLRREQMRAALASRGIAYREDSTNEDTAYTRNFIRHELLPMLERVHEGAVENISLMTESLAEDEAYLSELAEQLIRDTDVSCVRHAIATAATPIAKRALRLLYAPVKRSADAMTAEQLSCALALIRSDRAHASVTFPCGVALYLDRNSVCFRMTDDERQLLPHEVSLGENVFPETGECLILSDTPITADNFSSLNIYKLLIHSTLRFDTMDVRLYVRPKQDGDTYRFGGMTRTLKKLYNDKKLSLSARAVRPVLCDDKGILWVPGYGVRDSIGKTKNEGEYRIYACYCGFSEI